MARQKLGVRLLAAAVKHASPLSFLLCIAAWVTILAWPLLARNNYLDENALLPGAAQAKLYTTSLLDTAQQVVQHSLSSSKDDQVAAVLERCMQLLGLQWQSRNVPGSANCTVFHAVVPSTRGDGKEGLVLATPVSQTHLTGELCADRVCAPC